ncbi:Uncharacterised protein [Serratia ficaria]|uniref:hypothetical protein n=1 Tax=Serratia ficaria TaxID=61651 RepID=UPI002182EDA6|nr:hypothetical protein [Serratia ficaria]CAI2526679.1 Uncharacterised protein [Serratia ficaria]
MANLKLKSGTYFEVLADAMRYAVQDRAALIESYYTDRCQWYDRGEFSRPDEYDAYVEIKLENERLIADMEKIQAYAEKMLRGGEHG